MNYYEIPALSNIFLEDGYVLVVYESAGSLVFELDAVLTEGHPSYEVPKQGEQYCYRRALLSFLDVGSCEWLDRKLVAFLDGSGEVDHGNIDVFIKNDDCYMLSGDWGRVVIKHASVDFLLVE